MRNIDIKLIVNAVKNACMDSNYYLGNDVKGEIIRSYEEETWETARDS